MSDSPTRLNTVSPDNTMLADNSIVEPVEPVASTDVTDEELGRRSATAIGHRPRGEREDVVLIGARIFSLGAGGLRGEEMAAIFISHLARTEEIAAT